MQRIILFIAGALMILPLQAQKTKLDTTLVFTSNTGTKTVPVRVESGAEKINLQVEGEISTGSISVKLYDPDGKKQSGLQLKTSEGDDSKTKIKSKNTEKPSGKTGQGRAAEGDEGQTGQGASVHISTGEGTSVVSVSSNRNSNVNTNSNTNDGKTTTISVSSGEGNAEVVAGQSAGRNYAYTTSSSSKGAKGVLTESVDNPAPGTWRIEIVTEGVTGEIGLKVKLN